MNPEHVKFELSKIVTELVRLLQTKELQIITEPKGELLRSFLTKDVDIIESEADRKPRMLFNSYFSPKEYEIGLIDGYFGKLDQLIYQSHLIDLDKDKLIVLVESIAERLSFSEYYKGRDYDVIINQLNSDQIKIVEEFEATQITVHQTICERLTEKYLLGGKPTKIAKINWKGQQNQLAELFYALREKGWIETGVNHEAFYRTLGAIFICGDSEKVSENMKTYFKKNNMPNDAFKDIKKNE